MYDYKNFSKQDRKLFEPLLSKGIQDEIRQFSKKHIHVFRDISTDKDTDARTPYWELYEKMKDFSKHLTRTYDGYSHRDLPSIIANFLVDGDLKEAGIVDFSPVGKTKLQEMVNRIKSYRG